MSAELPGYIRDLLASDRYAHHPSWIRLAQTHISYVILAPPFVYKIKKPVYFGFLDFRTQEKRRYFCHEEVRLNRRTSRGVYLGVVDVSEVNGRYRIEDSRNPVEAAVKMRYLPDDRMLYSLVNREQATEEMVIDIARFIAGFHRHAATSPEISRYGDQKRVRHHAMENFEQIVPFVGTAILRGEHEALRAWTETELENHAMLFQARIREGRIRDGHGDLRPKHIYLKEDGISIIDCIEFNPAYRYQDVASDLAFLCMELDYQNHTDLSSIILNEYLAQSGDYAMIRLWNFYRVYRAMVRGKVACLTSAEPEIEEAARAASLRQAREFFALAEDYTSRKPRKFIAITCGLSGSGKSMQARRKAIQSGAVIIRSDTVRKTLAGIEPRSPARTRYGTGIYSTEVTEQTYDTMANLAQVVLAAGFPVILDATYSARRHRETARALADQLGVPFAILWCSAPLDILRQRLENRKDPEEPSDATPDILEAQTREFEPLTEAEKSFVLA